MSTSCLIKCRRVVSGSVNELNRYELSCFLPTSETPLKWCFAGPLMFCMFEEKGRERERWFLYFNCALAVQWLLGLNVSSSRCHGLVCDFGIFGYTCYRLLLEYRRLHVVRLIIDINTFDLH